MIPLPSKTKIVKSMRDPLQQKNANKATFRIKGLYPGYGITIGNSLRRVLLSSLSGAAITKVRFGEANHEFSTIPGVMEDVITIIANLRKLRFKLHSEEPQIARINIKGEKEVKGSDFSLPTQVELVNPDTTIFNITDKKTAISMEVEIDRGVGYSPAEERKEEKLEVGQMIVDCVFTPIVLVSFHTENIRVGKRTDFDRLFIEIETDGTITPKEAYVEAVRILNEQLQTVSLFEEDEESEAKEEDSKKNVVDNKKEEDKSKDLLISDLGLSARIEGILEENKIKKVKDLIKKTEGEILSLKGMGQKAIDEVRKKLKKQKLELSKDK